MGGKLLFHAPYRSTDLPLIQPINLSRKSSTVVSFSPGPAAVVLLEPEDRRSDFPARQADRERMERLLGPILTASHRQAVYDRIFGGSADNRGYPTPADVGFSDSGT